MKKTEATIITDSVGPNGNRITSIIVTFPRFILAELNTHRLFSKNSASSRAIPFKTMLESVTNDPFIPIAWQKDHPGMQGSSYFIEGDHEYGIFHKSMHDDSSYYDNHESWFGSEVERDKVFDEWGNDNRGPGPNYWHQNSKKISRPLHYTFTEDWLKARDLIMKQAKHLNKSGLTKQICNRLLEPFLWHTVLVTATEWDNFFELRTPKYTIKVDAKNTPYKSRKDLRKAVDGWWSTPSDWEKMTEADWFGMSQAGAEIHMQALAEAIWDAMKTSTPKTLEAGEWHIPFGDQIDSKELKKQACDYVNALEEGNTSGCMTTYDFPVIEAKLAIKIATARCARLSYMTFDKEIDYKKDIELYDRLLSSKHMSPFEHCARAMSEVEYTRYIKGPMYTMRVPHAVKHSTIEGIWVYPNDLGWCNNFKGFVQQRYLLDNPYAK